MSTIPSQRLNLNEVRINNSAAKVQITVEGRMK